jgi:RNA polymerase sigma factor (sigma-70 family)
VADEYATDVAEWQAIVRRDEQAFSRWFTRHEMRLRLSLRTFASVVDAEAIVQDTAVRVWERASTIVPDGRPAFLIRWAVTVAKNTARNQARREGRHVPVDPPSDIRMPDPALRSRIESCLERLPHKLRLVLERVVAEGGQRSLRELALAIGISFDAVRQNLTRARREIERCLGRHGIDVKEYLR